MYLIMVEASHYLEQYEVMFWRLGLDALECPHIASAYKQILTHIAHRQKENGRGKRLL